MLHTLKANSKARSEKFAAEDALANAQRKRKATTGKPRRHLILVCASAALRDGHEVGSASCDAKVVYVWTKPLLFCLTTADLAHNDAQ